MVSFTQASDALVFRFLPKNVLQDIVFACIVTPKKAILGQEEMMRITGKSQANTFSFSLH